MTRKPQHEPEVQQANFLASCEVSDRDGDWFEKHPGRLHYLRFATVAELRVLDTKVRQAVLVRKGNGGRQRIFDPCVLPDTIFSPLAQDENYLGAVFDCWWYLFQERHPENAKQQCAILFGGASPLTGCSHPEAPMAVINGEYTRPTMGVPEPGYENYSRKDRA